LPVKIGTSYLDLIPQNSTIEINKYAPVHNLTFTDSAGSTIYDLPKISGIESIDQIITHFNITDGSESMIEEMEKRSYPAEMVLGRERISQILRSQRELEIPGAAASFIAKKGKKNAGYILLLPENSEIIDGEKVAHIYDMVVLPEFKGTNVIYKMMERVFEVANSYDYNIEAEARESTSFALINNDRVRRWIESKGFKVVVCKTLEKYIGNENFYLIRFEKIK
jgi:GNAT superfamily N-acetyltransferase